METTPIENIVMIPFMAQGHLIPFLSLANKIHQKTGFTITLATTPLNTRYLKSATTTNPNIHLVSLPFDSSHHNLPPNTENTENLSTQQMITLFHASTSLETPFCHLISTITSENNRPPICIISDVFMGWVNKVAASFKTVNVSFTTGGAYGTAAYISIWQNLPHRFARTGEFSVPGFPENCCFNLSHLHKFIRDADGTDPWSLFFQKQLSLSLESFGWLCNSVEEIEPLGLEVLTKYTKLPVWCVGPLLPPSMLSDKKNKGIIGQHLGKNPGVSPEKCLEWLDLHPKGSVLYISFGSQNSITPTQMMELAKGLEDSGIPFIWVIRPPVGFSIKGEFKPEWLPKGFGERMQEKKKGLMVHQWAPQLEILSHQSIGAFLSHCGWNSVMESLSQGVPLIGWPLAAEQAYNVKMLVEEMKVCVEMARGLDSGIESEEVKRVVEEVMGVNGKGEEMRKKSVKIGELMRESVVEKGGVRGSSLQRMDDFVSTLLSQRVSSPING